jgi:hypothetical protein
MICHVVLYQLKGSVSAAQREQLVRDARQRLPKLPGVKSLRVGRNIVAGDTSFQLALYMEFDDEAELQRYRVDPDHEAFVRECVDPVVAHIQRFDFTTD